MNGNSNDDNRNRRPPPERQRQQNGPRPRQNNAQPKKLQQQQQQAAKPESPAPYVRKEAGAQHQPKCQDTAPLPPLKLDIVKHLWLEANFIMVLVKVDKMLLKMSSLLKMVCSNF